MKSIQNKGQQLLSILLLEAIEPRGIPAYRELNTHTHTHTHTYTHTPVKGQELLSIQVEDSYPEFERSNAFGVSIPEVVDQLPIPLGHHSPHPQGVAPVITA